MTHREMVLVTIYALRGERIGVKCYDHSDATFEFREYREWLSDKDPGATFAKSTLEARFDGGGCVRFISSSGHMDGLKCLKVTMDDVLR